VGVETLIVEQVAAIREVGAGLSIWSNAMKTIRELGVEVKVMAAASVIERSLSQSLDGHRIVVTDFSAISRKAGVASISVHRAVLQRVLFEELPPESILTWSIRPPSSRRIRSPRPQVRLAKDAARLPPV